MQPPAGWYPDPQNPNRKRYWNGYSWGETQSPYDPQPESYLTSGRTNTTQRNTFNSSRSYNINPIKSTGSTSNRQGTSFFISGGPEQNSKPLKTVLIILSIILAFIAILYIIASNNKNNVTAPTQTTFITPTLTQPNSAAPLTSTTEPPSQFTSSITEISTPDNTKTVSLPETITPRTTNSTNFAELSLRLATGLKPTEYAQVRVISGIPISGDGTHAWMLMPLNNIETVFQHINNQSEYKLISAENCWETALKTSTRKNPVYCFWEGTGGREQEPTMSATPAFFYPKNAGVKPEYVWIGTQFP